MHKIYLRKGVTRKFSEKQNATIYLQGQIGDGAGNIETGIPNKIFCRVGEQVIKAWAFDIPRVYGLSVYIVNSTKYPGDLEIESGNAAINTFLNANQNNVARHGREHEWMERDTTFIHLRQFLPLWIGPLQNPGYPYAIMIGRGVIWNGNVVIEIPAQVVDLSGHVPPSDALGTRYVRYVLVSISSAGEVVLTPGTSVLEADFGLDDLPAIPANTNMVLGAVRLYSDQVAITEARDSTDIIDLRYPYRHVHPAAETGGHDPVTVVDTPTINLSLTGQQISADVIQSALDPASMTSGLATVGQVPVANGSGGVAWTSMASGGLHAESHQNGGVDEINVTGLSGKLADPQTPDTHTHPANDITSGVILAGLSLKSDGNGGVIWQAEHTQVTLSAVADAILSLIGQNITLDNQSPNQILAGPVSGVAAAPAFRTLVAADMGGGTGTDGQVLTADGVGGAAWEAPSGGAASAGYMNVAALKLFI